MAAAVRRIVVTASLCIAMAGAAHAVAFARGAVSGLDEPRAEVTFTKWITVNPGFPLMEGFTGGEAAGTFTGEVLEYKTTADNLISRLVAV